MKLVLFIFISFVLAAHIAKAQLKFIIEDFEGFADGTSDLKTNGVFTYGNIKAFVNYNTYSQQSYLGQRFLKLNKEGRLNYGGFGKGIGLNLELDVNKDNLNFYILGNDTNTFKIELQEDDNDNNVYEKNMDDSWIYTYKLQDKNVWKLISIPLNKFRDSNVGGDGIFNISYKTGKFLCFIISFPYSPVDQIGSNSKSWTLDFICFSRGKLPTGKEVLDVPSATQEDFCNLGAWSKEGNLAKFTDIAYNFENHFKYGSNKKLGVIHFFQPFAVDGGSTQNLYPSIERINEVIQQGYIPMITLEDHFVNANPNTKQPNLYSIVEGHLDDFFADWAKQIKQVKGTVLLRILHEFNGDWYPWCIVNNDKDPKLFIKAFQHIHNIFKTENGSNVKFIWCPNSMSWPQEKWNYVMDAYPGDEYVDYLGLDIYNGAGKGIPVWRSFKKEGIENYFVLTHQKPHKPLFICETSSREREKYEPRASQSKAEWIRQMSETLSSDMSKIRLLIWFNEKKTFHINSSSGAQGAFLDYVLKNNYFKSGAEDIHIMLDK